MSQWKSIVDQASGPKGADLQLKERIKKALLRSCGKAGHLSCCEFNKLLKVLEQATEPEAIKDVAQRASIRSHRFSQCECKGDCPFPAQRLQEAKPKPPV